MKLATLIISLLFVTSFAILFFALSAQGAIQQQNGISNNKKLRNPIRDRYIPKRGLCPQNYVNGTRSPFKLWRMHKESGGCFRIDEKGPCGRNMQFYRIGSSDYGSCDCMHSRRCGRPLLYWKPTDSCFHVNTQGPCSEGQWIVYGLGQQAICQRSPCLSQEAESPSNHQARKFWTSINGQCIKTRSRGFCPDPEEVMFFREGEAYPRCVHAREATACNSMNRISRPCWAGQKYDTQGKCRHKVGLWGNEDDH